MVNIPPGVGENPTARGFRRMPNPAAGTTTTIRFYMRFRTMLSSARAWMLVIGAMVLWGSQATWAMSFETELIGVQDARAQWPHLDGVDDATGAVQRIAILDSGIDYDHSGFAAADGSSRVVAGINFAYDKPLGSMAVSDYADANGHGTMVAGIAAGSYGWRVGVAPQVELISVRVADAAGSASFSSILSGLNWVCQHAADYNITAVNLSIGSTSTYLNDDAVPTFSLYNQLRTAFDDLEAQGLVTTVAAGNGSSTTGLSFPAILDGALSVSSSTDSDNAVSHDANRNGELELLAPGESISGMWNGGGAGGGSGTSYASPFVAASSVLVRETYLQFTDDLPGAFATFQDRVVDLFQRTGKPITDAASGLTFKRIDVDAAIQAIYDEFDAGIEPGLWGDLCGDQTAGEPDGVVDGHDIDYLFAQLRNGATDARLDLDASGSVNTLDADTLVGQVLGTAYGDADLDGQLTVLDFSQWRHGFLNGLTGWANGDFDGDGTVTVLDFSIWRSGFLGTPVTLGMSATTVPEPATAVLALLSGLWPLGRPRDRHARAA